MAKKKQTGPVSDKIDGKRDRRDEARSADKIVYVLGAICGLLLAVDPLIHKHGPFAIEHWFGFYGIYAFLACVVLVLAAKPLRRMLMRSEDYYDD